MVFLTQTQFNHNTWFQRGIKRVQRHKVCQYNRETGVSNQISEKQKFAKKWVGYPIRFFERRFLKVTT